MKNKPKNSFLLEFLRSNIYFIFFAILIFITPMLVIRGANELYEFPKMYFMYFFGFFIIAYFLTDIILHPIKFKRPSILVILFMLTIILSTILSSNVYTSVFGYYSRFNDGLLSYLVFFGLYVVAINKLQKSDFVKLFKIALLTFIPISLFGLSQHFLIKVLWNHASVDRVFSTFGQPNWLAQYLAILLTICVYFALAEGMERFYIWVTLYFFGFFCFWLTYSLSGLLAFAIGTITLFLFFFLKEKFTKDHLIKLVVLGSLSLLVAVSCMGIFKERVKDAWIDFKKAQLLFPISYAASSDYKISDPGFIRKDLWESTYKLITSSTKIFLIGTGPETFPYTYQPFRSNKLNFSSEWDFVFNKPHNYYLEMWAESGLIALILYVLLITKTSFNSHYFVFPAISAFAVSNFFGWPVVSTAFLFWLFVSYSDIC